MHIALPTEITPESRQEHKELEGNDKHAKGALTVQKKKRNKLKMPISQSFRVSPSVLSTLCNHMDCSLLGFSVHGILQARILEWVAIHFSRRSTQTRDQTHISCIVGIFFLPSEPPGKL